MIRVSEKEFVWYRNSIQYGPVVGIHDTETISEIGSKYNNLWTGVLQTWLDTGGRFSETYYPTYDTHGRKSYADRDYLIDQLTVGNESVTRTEGDSVWRAQSNIPLGMDNDSIAMQTGFASCYIDPDAERAAEKLHGFEDTYRIDSKPYYFGGFFEGIRVGPHLTFWENGCLRTFSDWQDGRIVGVRQSFDEYGVLTAEQTFGLSGDIYGNSVIRRYEKWNDWVQLKQITVVEKGVITKEIDWGNKTDIFEDFRFNSIVEPLIELLKPIRLTS
ncbi:MAG: hypothetical protein ACK5PB_08785 [Pirellula sp.]|jgi:hypothetical protein